MTARFVRQWLQSVFEAIFSSLAPGKDADIAVFTGNPMEVFSRTCYTIIEGEVVYQAE